MRSASTRSMLFVTLFLFSSTTTFWVLKLIASGEEYQVVLINNPEMPLIQKIMMYREMSKEMALAIDWLTSFSVRPTLSY